MPLLMLRRTSTPSPIARGNTDWNGKFRKITVKTSATDVKIQCRPGYYAVADPLGSLDLSQTFSLMMQPSSPPSTTLVIKARVVPPDTQTGATRIDYLVDVHDLSFHQSADHFQTPGCDVRYGRMGHSGVAEG